MFIKGRVTVEEDKPAKMICQKITPFDEMPKQLWLQYPTREEYRQQEEWQFETLEHAKKQLPNSRMTSVCPELLEKLYKKFGSENVKVVQAT